MKMFPACTLPIRDDTSGKITKQWMTKVEEWANLCMEQGISEPEMNHFFLNTMHHDLLGPVMKGEWEAKCLRRPLVRGSRFHGVHSFVSVVLCSCSHALGRSPYDSLHTVTHIEGKRVGCTSMHLTVSAAFWCIKMHPTEGKGR